MEIPVIAPLNATLHGSWERYAKMMAEAAAEVEARQLEIVSSVVNSVDIQLALKVSPYYTSFAQFATAATRAGAGGRVVFNRFYAPDIDLDALRVDAKVSLSNSEDLRLSLRWIAILRAQLADAGLAATGDAHGWQDVVKSLLVGADVACTTAAVIQEGPTVITAMLDGVRNWLADHDYDSVDQLRGSMSAASVPDPSAYERSQYRAIVGGQQPTGLCPDCCINWQPGTNHPGGNGRRRPSPR